MQQQVRRVITRRAQAEHLSIKTVREPGERMPIQVLRRVKRPGHSVPVQSSTDLRVLAYANLVVVIQKWSARDWTVKSNRNHSQRKAQHQPALLHPMQDEGLSRVCGDLWARRLVRCIGRCHERSALANGNDSTLAERNQRFRLQKYPIGCGFCQN